MLRQSLPQNRLFFRHYSVGADGPRFHASVMAARLFGDERWWDKELSTVRERPRKAFRRRDANSLVEPARRAIEHLGRDSKRHTPLYLPPTLAGSMNTTSAPMVMDDVLRKILSKRATLRGSLQVISITTVVVSYLAFGVSQRRTAYVVAHSPCHSCSTMSFPCTSTTVPRHRHLRRRLR